MARATRIMARAQRSRSWMTSSRSAVLLTMTSLFLLDGRDVTWAGCSQDEFMNNYKAITSSAGKHIVFGAEIDCWRQDCSRVPKFPTVVPSRAWEAFTTCHDFWTDSCAKTETCELRGCSRDYNMEFLNSGFYMGWSSTSSRC